MAVVKNLMIRIGADYSGARKGMQGATRELGRFRRDTNRTTSDIRGRNGLGGIGNEFKNLSGTVSSSLSRLRGAKGIGGVTSELVNFVPALGRSATALRTMGAAAGGTTRLLGPLGIGIVGLTALLAVATVALYKASQPAVRFEADLGRLNMQLKGGTRDFMQWARAQGLAKSTSAQLGATYGVLLSSFGFGNKQLANETKQLVQTTRVVASATGRTIDDTMERIRSGLLGNTEAIEDLGIFVNVSMIESTNSFKKFANGKHWDQLDFRVQQQIRLAAILEQAYARYGDKLQNNVMTKQQLLTEQLKDIKLNLSQAFLPIWDSILPALTRLAEALATVTEELARFTYWVRGWDYDERTQGTNQHTDAVTDMGDSYEDMGKQAKAARKELAAFDQLNLLGDPTGGGLGSGGGAAGGTSGGGTEGGTGAGGGSGFPKFPPMLNKKWRIEFDTPNPPDAGLGAVATAVIKTVNQMIVETKLKLAKMWADLQTQTQVGVAGQLLGWNGLSAGVASGIVPVMTQAIRQEWSNMWRDLQTQTATNAPLLQTQVATYFSGIGQKVSAVTTQAGLEWKTMLSGMVSDLLAHQPGIATGWAQINAAVLSVKNPLTIAKEEWRGTLSYMLEQLNAHRPYIEWGWHLMSVSVRNIKSPLAEVKSAWSSTLSDMYTTASAKLGGIVEKLNKAGEAWTRFKQTLNNSPVTTPAVSLPAAASPSRSGTSPSPSPDPATSGSFFKGLLDTAKNSFSQEALLGAWDLIKGEANKPENKLAMQIYTTILPAGKIGTFTGKVAPGAITQVKKWWDSLKGLGSGIPAFASGAMVFGPTLAMVGDNKGASTDPEVIAPLSKLEEYMDGGDNSDVVSMLQRVEQAVKDLKYIQAVIARDAVGQAAVSFINDENRRGKNPLMGL